jgi:hypothetical protein
MKPKPSQQANPQRHLFMSEIISIINPGHAMVKLSREIDW